MLLIPGTCSAGQIQNLIVHLQLERRFLESIGSAASGDAMAGASDVAASPEGRTVPAVSGA